MLPRTEPSDDPLARSPEEVDRDRREYAEFLASCERIAASHARRPGIVERVTSWGLLHLGALFAVSLVGWLLFLATLALFLLPGCSGDLARRDQVSRNVAESSIVAAGAALASGSISPEEYASRVRLAFDELAASQTQNREDESAPFWLEPAISVAATALGLGALNRYRNRTRSAELEDVASDLASLASDVRQVHGRIDNLASRSMIDPASVVAREVKP